ncbi:hypothetical protein [Burkholderia sp. Ed8]|uniref:hypothetical protein n=1 Tax=Burkholderia sp. Ed8 TaxID=3112957 RepID=UPI00345CB4F1
MNVDAFWLSFGKQSPTVFFAMVATAVSVGIAVYAGWHGGGSSVERAISIALGCVAVLYVHMLPAGRQALVGTARLFAFVLWCIGLVVVLYGQVTFVLLSRQHAGDQRAARVPTTVPLSLPAVLPGRTLTEIAKDVSKAKIDLARIDERLCVGDCRWLKVRRTILATQITTLEAEAGEVRRRESEQDRRNRLADREAVLRATARADPVAAEVAPWLGTTEGRLEVLLAVACSVVLEGSAIIGWMLVLVVPSRVSSRDVVVVGRGPELSDQNSVVFAPEVVRSDHAISPPDPGVVGPVVTTVDSDNGTRPACPDDDLDTLKQIHEAVVAGLLRPTQDGIRKFLRCGQPRAGHLNRQYAAHFRSACTEEVA